MTDDPTPNRAAQAAALRQEGLTLGEIGARLGVTKQRAAQLLQRHADQQAGLIRARGRPRRHAASSPSKTPKPKPFGAATVLGLLYGDGRTFTRQEAIEAVNAYREAHGVKPTTPASISLAMDRLSKANLAHAYNLGPRSCWRMGPRPEGHYNLPALLASLPEPQPHPTPSPSPNAGRPSLLAVEILELLRAGPSSAPDLRAKINAARPPDASPKVSKQGIDLALRALARCGKVVAAPGPRRRSWVWTLAPASQPSP
jgi:hypothetical protein